MEKSIDLLGDLLMKHVRDWAIHKYDKIVSGEMKSANAQALKKSVEELNLDDAQMSVLRTIVISSIDDCIHNILFLLEEEQENVRLYLRGPEGGVLDVVSKSDGLAGELYTSDGWIAKYSRYSK